MVDMQTCTSCMLKWCQKNFVDKIKEKKSLNFVMACKFVMTCRDKNVICDCIIQGGKKIV